MNGLSAVTPVCDEVERLVAMAIKEPSTTVSVSFYADSVMVSILTGAVGETAVTTELHVDRIGGADDA